MGTLEDSPAFKQDNKPDAQESSEEQRKKNDKKTGPWILAGICAAILLIGGLPPLFTWQIQMQQRALSLTNMRRVATGVQMYAQDWDQRIMPPSQPLPDGTIWAWPHLARPYVTPDSAFSNPSNPTVPFKSKLRHPTENRSVDTSYALNQRFWNTFSPGPFPYENLELREQTVLLMESGHMAAAPRSPSLPAANTPGPALDTYGDTLDRLAGLSPYPSTHDGMMDVIAADGHGIAVKILYYDPKDGPHDSMYGRVGENIYNWNGGHPNGQTDTPPKE